MAGLYIVSSDALDRQLPLSWTMHCPPGDLDASRGIVGGKIKRLGAAVGALYVGSPSWRGVVCLLSSLAWVQESLGPAKEGFSTSESDSGNDSQNALRSKEQRPCEAGAAIVTIPKAEKDVDDFDVSPVILFVPMCPIVVNVSGKAVTLPIKWSSTAIGKMPGNHLDSAAGPLQGRSGY